MTAPPTPMTQTTPSRRARIVGKVEYREGDGANITIRPGLCEVQITAQDATLSWTDADTHGSTAMPIADFNHLIVSKAIQWLESAPG